MKKKTILNDLKAFSTVGAAYSKSSWQPYRLSVLERARFTDETFFDKQRNIVQPYVRFCERACIQFFSFFFKSFQFKSIEIQLSIIN